jgi:hypothetical protein
VGDPANVRPHIYPAGNILIRSQFQICGRTFCLLATLSCRYCEISRSYKITEYQDREQNSWPRVDNWYRTTKPAHTIWKKRNKKTLGTQLLALNNETMVANYRNSDRKNTALTTPAPPLSPALATAFYFLTDNHFPYVVSCSDMTTTKSYILPHALTAITSPT